MLASAPHILKKKSRFKKNSLKEKGVSPAGIGVFNTRIHTSFRWVKISS